MTTYLDALKPEEIANLMTYFSFVADTPVRIVYNRRTKDIYEIATIVEGRPIHIAQLEREQLTKMLPDV